MNPSLERIIPEELDANNRFDQATLQLHMERYDFALSHLQEGNILDIACGSGYGTYYLATRVKANDNRIFGVDISKEAIEYANQHYNHPAVRFIRQDATDFETSVRFNTIVCLETIEHLQNPLQLINKLHDLLLPGGIWIASCPVTPSTDANPHHLQNYNAAGFRKLFEAFGMTEEDNLLQRQPFSLSTIFHKQADSRLKGIRKNMFRYYLSHPDILWLRLASLLKDGLVNKYLTLVLRKHV